GVAVLTGNSASDPHLFPGVAAFAGKSASDPHLFPGVVAFAGNSALGLHKIDRKTPLLQCFPVYFRYHLFYFPTFFK
ncbi:hypothetical protein, partial [Enterococcus faecium]|uniref:hypothetical protein n=1 Tax=Enterococcus faecium TaxID=1352 RepID=UPI001C916442